MQKWEYLRVTARYEHGGWSVYININNDRPAGERTNDFTGVLNDFGEQGWEVVTAALSENGVTLFFKRPKN